MKKLNINNKTIFLIICLFLSAQMMFSQTYTDDENNSEGSTQLGGQNVSHEFFSSFFDTTINPKLSTVQGNSVFITQVGQYNGVAADIESNASEITISQNGKFNNLNLEYNVDKVVANLSQNGNSNIIKDYVIDANAEVSLDLKQNGNNLKFDKFGTNSITKNIKFTQTESSPSIIIRSFN
ncbi:hypothetical protein [Lacinutrix mariniflava]|uniref:hypothetical protein n=1 Tax=Lacinutrix mariniflava TaxID=342955 RepID=UPI0006E41C6B|nr:hypothetical protein [Lacinutrix mariniflava]